MAEWSMAVVLKGWIGLGRGTGSSPFTPMKSAVSDLSVGRLWWPLAAAHGQNPDKDSATRIATVSAEGVDDEKPRKA